MNNSRVGLLAMAMCVAASVAFADDECQVGDRLEVRVPNWLLAAVVEVVCDGHTWHGPVAKAVDRDFVVRPEEEDGPSEVWVYSGYVHRVGK